MNSSPEHEHPTRFVPMRASYHFDIGPAWTARDRRLSLAIDHARLQFEAAAEANDPELCRIFDHLLDSLEALAFGPRRAA